MEFIAKNSKETEKIGQELAGRLRGGDILCLEGNLGAGKTTLVKGLARAFGIKNDITSPTFALMRVYDTKAPARLACGEAVAGGQKHKSTPLRQGFAGQAKTFVHIDTYRLKDEQELIDIGAEDYLGKPDTICVIEWPEKIKGLLKNIRPQPKAGRARRIGLGPKKILNALIEYKGSVRKVTISNFKF